MQALTDNIYVLVILVMGGTFLIVGSLLILHAYNRNRLLRQKQLLQQQELQHQRQLLLTIFSSQEEERRRIGSDLHDSVGAALSSLRLTLDHMGTAQAQQLIDRIIGDVRNIAHNISPAILNLYGLSEAVEELADMINQGKQLAVEVDNQAEAGLSALSHPVMLSIYRVLEELLNNTIRHAGATTVLIRFFKEDEQLVMTYADNGKGLAADLRKGMGLVNITNRLEVAGAGWELGTAPQQGFFIRVTLVLKNNQ
ncbi:hypothetical protein F0L74_22525 [Chitinophaga agrisoli]|uniref:histidine kinase n=1 Tax=Chitinophaga agrisoli TaxID=2607653 RepID=A0A5B2VL19_9BACT|nr:histidine kinase [Chitinophaga agrisoli]KAA2238992.1 hypothetical protein F0L74_22525 [Chitinophaga agrisoli]